MQRRESQRTQRTRERIRDAAQRLFLRQGYLATSTDAILAEAGISSKETLYRHYASKEELFVDVLGQLSLDQPGLAEKIAALPAPRDLQELRHTLRMLAREILSIMSQPEYLALVRMVIAEAPRFPQLGALFFSTVPLRGLSIITGLLRAAREQQVIADIDFDVVARALLGGLLSYAIPGLISEGEPAHAPALENADAIVEVVLRSLTPQ
jgi:TetR/AcrR family transcriptional repressor of mexJK operon